jgi:hypothetical protein
MRCGYCVPCALGSAGSTLRWYLTSLSAGKSAARAADGRGPAPALRGLAPALLGPALERRVVAVDAQANRFYRQVSILRLMNAELAVTCNFSLASPWDLAILRQRV